MRIELEKGIAS